MMRIRIELLLTFFLAGYCCEVLSQTKHTIQRGETYELIARRYNISLNELMAVNPNEEGCFVGMIINIPESSRMSINSGMSIPKDVAVLDKAADLIKSGKYKKATSAYSVVLKKTPSASAYFGRGISYYNREKYKSAIEDFEHALKCPDCTEEMQERCKDLISDAETLRAEQHERRNSIWGGIAAVVVGAAAITATAAMTSDSNSGTMYMPPSNINGFQRDTSLDYLLDPRYTIMQVNQQNQQEYLQQTNGGQTMSYDEWYAKIKAPAIKAMTESENRSTMSSTPLKTSSDSDMDDSRIIRYGYKDCPHCMGSGKCKTCNGTGIQDHMKSILCGVCSNHNGKCIWCSGTGKRYGSL